MTENTPTPHTSQSPISNETGQGSLEQGLAGNYQLCVGEVVQEAWGRVAGNNSALWIGALIYIAVHFGISLVLGLFVGGDAPSPAPDAAAVASGRTAIPTSVFSWYDRFLKLVLTWILMVILILIGTVLLVLPGIYLAVSYQLALPLVADKGLGPWEALETSRKTVTHKWFTFFGLNVVAGLAATGSVLLLGIPLIWVLPACLIGIGIMYRNAIGVESATLQRVSN